jgi:TonB family protein
MKLIGFTMTALIALQMAGLSVFASAEPFPAEKQPFTVECSSGPTYPEDAIENFIEGRVDLEILVGADGKPKEIKILTSIPPGVFDKSAISAMEKCAFKRNQYIEAGKEFRVKSPLVYKLHDTPQRMRLKKIDGVVNISPDH